MAIANLICKNCFRTYVLKASPAIIKRQKYCSRICARASLRDAAPTWEVAMRERLKKRQKTMSNGCIEYTGQSWGKYGQLEYRRKTYLAHRAAWELENGPIPPKMCICHSCDNPKCINPSHLFLGTYSDNVKDMIKKNRARYNPRRKLNDAQVLEIKRRTKNGETNTKVANAYGISQGMVSMISNGKRYVNIDVARS